MGSLLKLKTDLKSIKYGHDRANGGNSGQPYIKTDINTVDKGINKLRFGNFDDGLVRGGVIGMLNSSITDTLRIGKFLTDTPKGPLFIIKQVGLQLSNPRLETRKLSSPNSSGFLGSVAKLYDRINDKVNIGPTRIYNLGINTLAQVPINGIGGHIVRHGLLPVQDERTKYISIVTANNKDNNRLEGLASKFNLGEELKGKSPILREKSKFNNFINSALPVINLALTAAKLKPLTPKELIIDSYLGGPGSVYGIGSTLIKRYDRTRTKEQGIKDKTNPDQIIKIYDPANDLGLTPKSIYNYPNVYGPDPSYIFPTSNDPKFSTYKKLADQIKTDQKLVPNKFNNLGIYNSIRGGEGSTLNSSGSYSSTDIGTINYKNTYGEVVTIKKPNWAAASREIRVGSGRKDLINLTPLFEGEGGSAKDTIANLTIPGNPTKNINDLVKFRIQAIDTDKVNTSVWMIFRAYITALSDSVDAQWNDVKYVGRGDKFYIYDGFSRKMSVSFKVAALSAEEMRPMYQKLNYLMSNLMPDYSNNLMRGPLVRMTIGNYIDGQLCKLDSVSYTIPQDSPWEIAINDTELILPHIIEVQLSFTPIGSQTQTNNFTPQKSDTISNIAQNYNGKSADTAGNYIDPTTSSILKSNKNK